MFAPVSPGGSSHACRKGFNKSAAAWKAGRCHCLQTRNGVFCAKSAKGYAAMPPQGFETDFWKDAKVRKSWDEIVPGEPRKTLPYVLTPQAIELYCKSVGEDHPI